MELKLLINDTEYLQVFAEMLMNCGSSVFAERVDSFVESAQGKDVLYLTDSEDIGTNQDENVRRKMVLLTHKKADVNLDAKEGMLKVFKYDSVSNILSQLVYIENEVYSADRPKKPLNGKFFVICGTSEAQLTYSEVTRFVARQLAYNERNDVLVLSFQYVNSYRDATGLNSFARLIYSLQRGIGIKKEAFFYEDEYGVSYIRTNETMNRLCEFKESEMRWLISELLKLFPTIVIDVGTCLNKTNLGIVQDCEELFFVSDGHLDRTKIFPDFETDKVFEIRHREGKLNCEMALSDEISRRYGKSRWETEN